MEHTHNCALIKLNKNQLKNKNKNITYTADDTINTTILPDLFDLDYDH